MRYILYIAHSLIIITYMSYNKMNNDQHNKLSNYVFISACTINVTILAALYIHYNYIYTVQL